MSGSEDPGARIAVVKDGTVFYYEDPGTDAVRYEGEVEIYHGWVHFNSLQGGWVPREKIEQIHEF